MTAKRAERYVALLAVTFATGCAPFAPGSASIAPIQASIFFHSERLLFQRVVVDGPVDRIVLVMGGAGDPMILETRRLHDGSSVATITGSCSTNPDLTVIPAAHVDVEACDAGHGSVDLRSIDETTGRPLARRRVVGDGTYALGTSALLVPSDLTSARVLDARTLRPLGPLQVGKVEYRDGTRAIVGTSRQAEILDEHGIVRRLGPSLVAELAASQDVDLLWPGRAGALLDAKTFVYEDLSGRELRRIRLDSDETAVQADASGRDWLDVATVKRSGRSFASPIFARYDPDGDAAGRLSVPDDFSSGTPELIAVDGKTVLAAGTRVGVVDWSRGTVAAALPVPPRIEQTIRVFPISGRSAVCFVVDDPVGGALVESLAADAATPVEDVDLEAGLPRLER